MADIFMIVLKRVHDSISPPSAQSRKKDWNEPRWLGRSPFKQPCPREADSDHNASFKIPVVLQKPFDFLAKRFVFFQVKVVSFVGARAYGRRD